MALDARLPLRRHRVATSGIHRRLVMTSVLHGSRPEQPSSVNLVQRVIAPRPRAYWIWAKAGSAQGWELGKQIIQRRRAAGCVLRSDRGSHLAGVPAKPRVAGFARALDSRRLGIYEQDAVTREPQ